MAKVIKGGVVDAGELKKIIKKFLDTGSITVSKGRFPVRLPRYNDRLAKAIDEACAAFAKDRTDLFPGLEINLGEIHYRFEDVSDAFEEFKKKAISTIELPIVGFGTFHSMERFNCEVNRALDELLGLYNRSKETGITCLLGGEWEDDAANPMNIRRELILSAIEG
jgi:hypothetical protein